MSAGISNFWVFMFLPKRSLEFRTDSLCHRKCEKRSGVPTDAQTVLPFADSGMVPGIYLALYASGRPSRTEMYALAMYDRKRPLFAAFLLFIRARDEATGWVEMPPTHPPTDAPTHSPSHPPHPPQGYRIFKGLVCFECFVIPGVVRTNITGDHIN